MLLYFLRHAEAEPEADSDYERRLTDKGLAQADKAGKFMLRLGLIPEAIVSSPVVRAIQTAKIVAQRLGDASVTEASWLACGMTPEVFFEKNREFVSNESILFVGHEPDFGETIASLIGLPDSYGLKIRKSSLTAIDLTALEPGAGQLQFMVPVRLM